MFTGIVHAIGVITSVTEAGAQSRITIGAKGLGEPLQHGESVAIDGVCLTVASHSDGEFVADVMQITRHTTTLGGDLSGRRVNLERAVRASDRLGGHIMQGHVDGVATLIERDSQPDWDNLTFELPAELTRYVVAKGSIALNGVSLTVASVDGARVTVSLIPTTLAETTFSDAAPGDRVNVEVDVIAKYVERMVGERA